jgi:hypothetical protein
MSGAEESESCGPASSAGAGSSRSFAGDPRERWSLPRAVDALAHSARAAGRPGWIWLAGVGYPTIGMGLATGWASSLLARDEVLRAPGSSRAAVFGLLEEVAEALAGGALFFPLLVCLLRLRVGLAHIASPGIWARLSETSGHPRLRQAWRAGSGLTLSALGMSLMLTVMMSGVLTLVVTPVVYFLAAIQRNLGDLAAVLGWLGLIVPGVLVLGTYAVLLSVLHQLALQSLAHNRRGVSSALLHAWRLAKHDPWSTARTLAVDLTIDLSVAALSIVVGSIFGLTCLSGLAALATLALYGFMGVTRAGYWARAYRALGGLSPDDQVPGLASGVDQEWIDGAAAS